MKKLILLIIFFLIIENLFAEIAVKSFRKLENDMTARIDAPMKDQNGDVCAIIKVVTTQSGFSWEPDALGIVAAVPKIGEYWLYVPFGAKRLTIKHPQLGILRDFMYNMPIEKACVYEMILISGKVITTVEGIEKQWLVITPYPEKAMIYIDDNFVSKGEYQTQRIPGKFSYRVEAPLYHTEAGIIELTDVKKELKVSLKPAFGYLNINTTPESGATIIVDGKELSKTSPASTDALASGEHTVQVIKEMYQPATLKVLVKDGQTTPLSFNLSPNFAELNITSSKEAIIFINGQIKGTGTWSGRLSPGVYSLEAQLKNHEPAKQDIDLIIGDVKTTELYPVPIYGILDVITSPSGANININGIDYGTSPNTIKSLFPGEYNIILKKDLYDPIERKVSIEANKKSIINEFLPFGTQIDFESNPSEVDFYIDGFQVGKTPLSLNLKNGKHILKLVNGNKIKVDTIDIFEGCNKTYKYDLNNEIISVSFNGKLNKTTVSVDGRLIGEIPTNTMLALGNHRLKLTKGKEVLEKEIKIEPDGKTNFKFSSLDFIKGNYKKHFLGISYAYHETSFLNSAFSDRIKNGSITKEYGQSLGVYGVLYPCELTVTAFMSGFRTHNIAPFIDNATITHQGIETSVNFIPFSIGNHVIPYVGVGFQFSRLYSADGSELIPGAIISGISMPVIKGGLKLKLGQFFFFGEYKQTFGFDISDYKSSQLTGGIGWIF